MNSIPLARLRQADTPYKLRCTGCGRKPPCLMAPLFDEDHLGFLCPPCIVRYEGSAEFRQIVEVCIMDDRAMPEVEAAFADYGLTIPTTPAELQAATMRIAEVNAR